jgi:hypothetical protein
MIIAVARIDLDSLDPCCIKGPKVATLRQEIGAKLKPLRHPNTDVNSYFYGRLGWLLTKLNFKGATQNDFAMPQMIRCFQSPGKSNQAGQGVEEK